MTITSTAKTRLLASSLAILLAATATQAARADEVQTTTRAVSLHGLDLATQTDQAILKHRLEAAARNVCREDGESFESDAFETCRKAAFRDAWNQAQVQIASAVSRNTFAAAAKPAWAQPRSLVASAAPVPR